MHVFACVCVDMTRRTAGTEQKDVEHAAPRSCIVNAPCRRHCRYCQDHLSTLCACTFQVRANRVHGTGLGTRTHCHGFVDIIGRVSNASPQVSKDQCGVAIVRLAGKFAARLSCAGLSARGRGVQESLQRSYMLRDDRLHWWQLHDGKDQECPLLSREPGGWKAIQYF